MIVCCHGSCSLTIGKMSDDGKRQSLLTATLALYHHSQQRVTWVKLLLLSLQLLMRIIIIFDLVWSGHEMMIVYVYLRELALFQLVHPDDVHFFPFLFNVYVRFHL